MKKEISNWLILLLAVVIILFLPRVLTIPSFWKGFDFSGTGEIGDTIGGITAPFIGLLSSILLYLALIQQIKANQLVNEQFSVQRSIDIENEQFSLLLNKIREWKKEESEIKFYHSRQGLLNIALAGTNSVGKQAIYDIYREVEVLGTSQTLEATEFHRVTDVLKVTDYLNDILVYLYAIIPNINSKEKLKLILLELDSINRDIVHISPNITNILIVNHLSKPVGIKEKYQIIKTYTIRNYQMLKIEKQLFDYFNPNYNYENDTTRNLKYSPIARIEHYLQNDNEYRNEIKTITLN